MKLNRTIPQLIGEITSLAVLITINTEHDVITEYSGHVKLLQVRIFIGGWESNKYSTDGEVWCNTERYAEKDIIKKLCKLKHTLILLARKDKLNFSKLPYEIEEVKCYRLV